MNDIDKPLSRATTERWIAAMRNIISIHGAKNRAVFAKSLGFTPQNLSLIEKGSRNITLEGCILICMLYRVSAEWLLLGKGDMYGNSVESDRINSLASQIDELTKRLDKFEGGKQL